MTLTAPHQQYLALKAIRDHLNSARAAKITQEQSTVLPETDIHDMPDEEKAFTANKNPQILTHLSLSPDETTGQNFVGNSGAEVNFPVVLDWLVFVPRQLIPQSNDVYYAGLREIEAILAPLQETGLTDPETDTRRAVSFQLVRATPNNTNLGDHLILSCQIGMGLTLFSRSVIS